MAVARRLVNIIFAEIIRHQIGVRTDRNQFEEHRRNLNKGTPSLVNGKQVLLCGTNSFLLFHMVLSVAVNLLTLSLWIRQKPEVYNVSLRIKYFFKFKTVLSCVPHITDKRKFKEGLLNHRFIFQSIYTCELIIKCFCVDFEYKRNFL